MVVIIIRDGDQLSIKSRFVVQFLKLGSNTRFFYVFRNEQEKFKEKLKSNKINLATSIPDILLFFVVFFFLKSPKDLHDGIIRRIYNQKTFPFVRNGGFITVLSQALYQYFGRSGRTDELLRSLRKFKSPKIFVIDEFFSLNVVDLKSIKNLGPIIYVSSDLAYDFYGDNFVASKLMYKLEHDLISFPDLVIACSKRDKIKYEKLGAKKVIYYPNIYPIKEFELCEKDQIPSISIVLQGHWGFRVEKSLDEIFKALTFVNKNIRVNMIGKKPQNIPNNIEFHHYDYIPNKLTYLKILSKSWIGINIGVHLGGTNQRKYDYGMAGLVVFSDTSGVRGDLLLHEYAYVDIPDLVAKLQQLLELKKDKITEMGIENREYALSFAKKKRRELQLIIKKISSHSNAYNLPNNK